MIILWAGLCFITPPLFTAAVRCAYGLPLRSPRFFSMWASAGAAGVAVGLSGRDGTAVAAYGASALTGMVLWWYSRRKRKRSLRQLGNKARARLAAMLRNMPRPSPRLVPQGARA